MSEDKKNQEKPPGEYYGMPYMGMRMGNEWESEFKDFKNEVKSELKEIKSELKEQLHASFIKQSSVTIGAVAIAFFSFAWIFDYRLDFTNTQYEARFSRIEDSTILNEIRELKAHYSGFYNKKHKFKKIRKAKPHK